MKSINMLSAADKVKGQGVGSAYIEQVKLVKNGLNTTYEIFVNKWKLSDIMHYHTIGLRNFLTIPFARFKGVNIGYVHFLPETVDGSIELPKFAKKIFYWYIIKFYKSMDYLVTVNPYFIKKLEEHGVNKDKVAYIPNFVSDTNFFEMDQTEKNQLREKYGLDKDKFVVLGVGQVQTRKGMMDGQEKLCWIAVHRDERLSAEVRLPCNLNPHVLMLGRIIRSVGDVKGHRKAVTGRDGGPDTNVVVVKVMPKSAVNPCRWNPIGVEQAHVRGRGVLRGPESPICVGCIGLAP